MKKKNILIAINDGLYYRNFITTDAFKKLAEKYELFVVMPESVTRNKIDKDYLKIEGIIPFSPFRSKMRIAHMYISMWAYRRFSSTFPLKFKADVGPKRRLLYYFLSLPIIRHSFVFLCETMLGTHNDIDNIFKRLKPSFVIVPSQGNDALAIDYLKSAKKYKVTAVMLINGWDNLSSKGKMFFNPDILGVWSEQNKEHAVRIHNVPKEKVVILGVPHFQKYYEAIEFSKDEFKRILGVPRDKNIVLFGGCSRPVNEISLLDELENAIENNILEGIHILYRPHPWRHKTTGEDSFFARSWQHITLDPQLIDSYRRAKEEGISPTPKNTLPDLDYYPKLFQLVSAVISPLSTMLIESAVNGRPAMAISFSAGRYSFSLKNIYKCEHFRYLDTCRGIIVCNDRKKFISDCQRLLALSKHTDIDRILKEDMKGIVYSDHDTYSQRLLKLIERYDRSKPR